MIFAGTDAHHSLLNDPVLLAPPTESQPSDGMDISYEASRVCDENTDPSFIPDDLPYSGDDIFDKSAYISMGDNAADESNDELLDELTATPPVESTKLFSQALFICFIVSSKSPCFIT